MADLKPYPAIKDSGVPWLGQVPMHWGLRRGKYLFHCKKEINADGRHTNVLSLTLRGVVNNDPDCPEGLVPKDYTTYQFFAEGDLVFKLIDLENLRTSRVGLVHEDGIMSPAYVRLVSNHTGNQRFFFQQYYDLYQRGVLNRLGSGVRATLGPKDLLELPILVPERSEQTAIVRYLDYIERRVKRYIRAKQKLIGLLDEQKQAILNRAVTRGLDPNVPLKPSGVEWLGDIPEHWEVFRTRYLFKEVDLRSTTGKETHLSMSQRLGLVPSHMVEKTLASESYAGGKLCERHDLVLNRLKAHLGVFALAEQPGVISPDYSVYRKRRPLEMAYYGLVLRSAACRSELRIRAKGIVEGFWRLYTDDFFDIRLPNPPLEEQGRIVTRLRQATANIDIMIDRARQQAELLREYHTRLIADVVTGKLDVRDVPIDDAVGEHAPDHNAVLRDDEAAYVSSGEEDGDGA
jgi:type I restriction enzyme S subunit